jgi:hypothetical protein
MGIVDDITKKYISHNTIFADLCNYHLFSGRQVITPDKLQEQDVTELGVLFEKDKSATVQKMRDVLKKCTVKTSDDVVYMIVGVENQSDVHYAMAVKNMVYDAINYANQVEKISRKHRKNKDLKGAEFLSGFAKTDKINPVITITVYWKAGKWDGPRSLYDMFDEKHKELLRFVPNYILNLIVPDEIEDFTRFCTELGSVMKFISCSEDKEELKEMFSDCGNDDIISLEAANLLNECFDAGINLYEMEGAGVHMCSAMQELIEEEKALGREIGRAEGRAEGEARMVISLVENFSKNNNISINEALDKLSVTAEEYNNAKALLA